MANFLDQLNQGLIIVAESGEVQYVNPVALKSAGYMPGSKISGGPMLEAVRKCIASPDDKPIEIPRVLVPTPTAQVRVQVMKGPRPQSAVILTSKALTPAEATLEAQKMKAARLAAEAEEVSLKNVMTVITHDLRDPLHFLSNTLKDLLSQGYEQDAEQAGVITARLDEITATLSRLVEMSPLWGDAPLLKDDRVLVQPLIEGAWLQIAEQVKPRQVGIKITGTPAEELAPIYGSQVWLRRVIAECMLEKIEHAQLGATIEILHRQSGQFVTFNIIDTGRSPVDRSGSKFLPYPPPVVGGKEQTRTPRIGMLMCARVIELHGGRIMHGTEDDPDQLVIQIPSGAPSWQAVDAQIAIQQAEKYAHDISLMMTRRKKQREVETAEAGVVTP